MGQIQEQVVHPRTATVVPHPMASKRLVSVVQSLSRARDLQTVMDIVKTAARALTGADGATFVLRDGDYCYYADEDAIRPLWKGNRFPLEICISGWVMLNKTHVVLPDIYKDPRIPTEAYRPTFVKSLAMVPIRSDEPLGAIGNYWSTLHQASPEQLEILQALADSTAVAMENIQLYSALKTQNEELEKSNRELKRLSWAASHDLKEPVRAITTHLQLLERRSADKLDKETKEFVAYGVKSAFRLHQLVDDIFSYSRLDQGSLKIAPVDLNAMLNDIVQDIHLSIEETNAEIHFSSLPTVYADTALLRRVFQNLICNAIKFHHKGEIPRIDIEVKENGAEWLLQIRDNGIGVESGFEQTIFDFLSRLHPSDQYPGSGIGLAISKKIVQLHRGRIWVEPNQPKGSSFCFTLPRR